MSFAHAILIFGIHLNKGICLLFCFFSSSSPSPSTVLLHLRLITISILINAELKGKKCVASFSTRIMWGAQIDATKCKLYNFFLFKQLSYCEVIHMLLFHVYCRCVYAECVGVSMYICAYVWCVCVFV